MINDDGNIDYSKYTFDELYESQSGINPEKYPQNFANLMAEFERRGLDPADVAVDEAANDDDAPSIYEEEARSPIKARLTGLGMTAVGALLLLVSFRDGDGVLHGRRGREYTFDEDPFMFSLLLGTNALIIAIGLLGLIFGSKFFQLFVRSNKHQ